VFNLTRQERQVILFLLSAALLGLGINFLLKINPGFKKIARVEKYVTHKDLNRVSYQELLLAPGLSPALAKKIISYRNTHGRFKDLQQLKEIKGIGDCRYQKLEALFYVE